MFKNDRKYYIALILLLLVDYWFIMSFQFAMKNDALTNFLPARMQMSEAIHHGYIPWWTPYMNFGMPFHADLNSGFWSPITLFFVTVFKYNIYTLHLEFMFYVILAGVGMFRLGRYFKWSSSTSFVIAMCYANCGYIVGNAQHITWVAAAGLLPFLIYYFKKLLDKQDILSAAKLAVVFYLCFTSSHPGIFISFFYALLFLWIYSSIVNYKKKIVLTELKYFAISAAIFFAVALPSILSFYEVLEYFNRANIIDPGKTLYPFNWKSFVSFILPLAVTKNDAWYQTDIAMRNGYIGIIGIAAFLYSILFMKARINYLKGIYFIAFFFLVLSTGGLLKDFIHSYMPLFAYIRHDGIYRLIPLFGFLFIGGFALEEIIDEFEYERFRFKLLRILYFILMVLIAVIGTAIYILFFAQSPANKSFKMELFHNSTLKGYLTGLNIWETVLIQGSFFALIVLIFILVYRAKIHVVNFKRFLMSIVLFELMASTTLQAPFTIVGDKRAETINNLVNHFPKGYPNPLLQPVMKQLWTDSSDLKTIGSWSYFNKQIGVVEAGEYPFYFNEFEKLNDSRYKYQLYKNPFVFFADSTALYKDSIHCMDASCSKTAFTKKPYTINDELNSPFNDFKNHQSVVTVNSFAPTIMSFHTESSIMAPLVLMQNYYQHWEVSIDGEKATIVPCNYSFMSVMIPAGKHEVVFKYNPVPAKILLLISSIIFGLILIYIGWNVFFRSSPPSSQKK
jgi:hypothetical protein